MGSLAIKVSRRVEQGSDTQRERGTLKQCLDELNWKVNV